MSEAGREVPGTIACSGRAFGVYLRLPGLGRSNSGGDLSTRLRTGFVDVSWFSRTRSEGSTGLSARPPLSADRPCCMKKGGRGMSIADRQWLQGPLWAAADRLE